MNDLDARAQIAAGLSSTDGPFRDDPDRDRRRQSRAAADFRRSPVLDAMAKQLREDPAGFDRDHGAHGRIAVGLYESGARAAGVDLTAVEEEA